MVFLMHHFFATEPRLVLEALLVLVKYHREQRVPVVIFSIDAEVLAPFSEAFHLL
jgi:hypothetical protein